MYRFYFLLFFAFETACADFRDTEIVYVDVFDGGSFSLFPRAQMYGFLDIEGKAGYCLDRDKFACVSSELFNFAVPRTNLDGIEDWVYEGIKYWRKPKVTLKFLGREIEVYAIRSNTEGVENTFLYSPEDGLVAVMFKTDKQSKVYWVVQKTGFGKVE